MFIKYILKEVDFSKVPLLDKDSSEKVAAEDSSENAVPINES